MNILRRKKDESVMIGDYVEVTVIDVRGDNVRLGITAPRYAAVHRREIYDTIQRERFQNNSTPQSEENMRVQFSCSGAYDKKDIGSTANLEVNKQGKKVDCRQLNSNGYCSLCIGAPTNKCPFNLEKLASE